jgi:Xaa-Pro dipeptidase
MANYQERLAKFQQLVRDGQAHFALFGASDNMRYLTGWAEHGHERLVGLIVPAQGESVFLVPALNAMQAKTNPAGVEKVIGWNDETGWIDHFLRLLDEWKINRQQFVALIDDELIAAHLLKLLEYAPQSRYVSTVVAMTHLRQIKAADEIAAMDAAGKLIDSVVEEIATHLHEGDTEEEVQGRVHELLKQHNTRASFTPLICFGANTAKPHHHSGTDALQKGDMVIIDIGCIVDGYPSDITRTFSFGEPNNSDAQGIYDIVSKAHWAAREAAKPGVTGADVDAAARQVITDAGYGEFFIHRTGHGIGLSTHEPPDIVASNTEPLQPGMCFSIEPGIYLPDQFGVRIENIVTMTETGVVSLNAEAPRTLRVLPV